MVSTDLALKVYQKERSSIAKLLAGLKDKKKGSKKRRRRGGGVPPHPTPPPPSCCLSDSCSSTNDSAPMVPRRKDSILILEKYHGFEVEDAASRRSSAIECKLQETSPCRRRPHAAVNRSDDEIIHSLSNNRSTMKIPGNPAAEVCDSDGNQIQTKTLFSVLNDVQNILIMDD